jgi:hypothetical protein
MAYDVLARLLREALDGAGARAAVAMQVGGGSPSTPACAPLPRPGSHAWRSALGN